MNASILAERPKTEVKVRVGRIDPEFGADVPRSEYGKSLTICAKKMGVNLSTEQAASAGTILFYLNGFINYNFKDWSDVWLRLKDNDTAALRLELSIANDKKGLPEFFLNETWGGQAYRGKPRAQLLKDVISRNFKGYSGKAYDPLANRWTLPNAHKLGADVDLETENLKWHASYANQDNPDLGEVVTTPSRVQGVRWTISWPISR
ncbi:MAG: hypothetical protein H6922_04155 [Pseudomonadaceae bacterium]|nr:hypothetical protein [Pseudomonadaceae bacterium]